ncbi:MAG: hypothetical protein NTY20_05935 [Candidatus Aenigmarchaeota archaeon]|nr:hypothetical protein [Candidatus Aenigmarchaeota archaeon]
MKLAILKIFTVLWLMGMYLTLMITFIVAYQSPQKAVRVVVNNYNEANTEMLMLLAALFITTLGTAFLISDIRRDFLDRRVKLLSRMAD